MASTNVPENVNAATLLATSSAAAGGQTDTITLHSSTIRSSVLTSSRSALTARAKDSLLRPSPAQTTRAPLSFALKPIEAPMVPGCKIPAPVQRKHHHPPHHRMSTPNRSEVTRNESRCSLLRYCYPSPSPPQLPSAPLQLQLQGAWRQPRSRRRLPCPASGVSYTHATRQRLPLRPGAGAAGRPSRSSRKNTRAPRRRRPRRAARRRRAPRRTHAPSLLY